ncbi:MAG: hypothetical protein M3O61_08815 [Gemmatimonadota bacterium]|nr:hypothetical protein [Gemmatimonadota bacterium]
MGRIIWSALLEIEAFYNFDKRRATFSRTYLADVAPPPLQNEVPPFWRETQQAFGRDFPWKAAQGQFSRTYDFTKMIKAVKQILEPQGGRAPYLVVIDQQLTPPKNWNYIISDSSKPGAVMSISPTDPQYWRDKTSERLSIIKHRIRALGINNVGEMLGLKECDNPECFLYSEIDSVATLDTMVKLGPEHKMPGLVDRGFPRTADDPANQASIVRDPIAPEWAW